VLRDERFAERVFALPAPELIQSGNKKLMPDVVAHWSYRLLSAAAASCRK
jgi:hypothetical protein